MECKINIQERKRKQGVRKLWFVVLLFAYILFICASVVLKNGTLHSSSKNLVLEESFDYHHVGRHRRDTRSNNDSFVAEDKEERRNCTPRAIDQFPANWFTLQETKNGAMALHIFLSLYMFGALAIVCDDYFVSSLECICERLHLQEDVAGATFMAAGSSAPEFFTSVIGVFIAKSDVGVGTIVGSAVFNILFIIGVCAIFAGMVVKLTWYPMTRDCLFYLISISALVSIINDERVYWYEALILVFLYILYIVVMFFNRTLEAQAITLSQRLKRKLGINDNPLNSKAVTEEKQPLSAHSQNVSSYTNTMHVAEDSISKETQFTETTSACLENTNVRHEKEYESPFVVPDSMLAKLYWAVMMPLKVLMYLTIPDCRKDGIFKRLYMLTFTLSIIWIAGSAYIMVWMVTIIGDALEIPDTVMGLTILAAGTSVPDCLSSVFVARDGYGDMAVSNSIGSNVFDILICLGLPWLLGTTIVKKGDPIFIHSGGMIYSSLILLLTVAFMLVGINLAKWTLRKLFGCLCLLAYCIVMTTSCLFELNVFGDFVLPSCDRT